MFENLESVEKRFDEIQQLLFTPEVATDAKKFSSLVKEQKSIELLVEKYRELKRAQSDEAEALELLSDGDKELKALASLQLEETRQSILKLSEEIKILLIPKDPLDAKNVIMEIRGGTGGEESALFAGTLFRMYSMYAEKKRWKVSIISANETQLGGFKEIVFSVEGDGAYSRLKFESGVHRVQRVPETETQGRIHTSAATVAVLPEAEDVEININPADLQIDTFRSSGAGGQHINKTESAIRITHLPTGLVVECQDERSQHKNKAKAMKVLQSRLAEAERKKKNDAIAGQRRSMVGSGDRSEKIRTYNFPQYRISDHRIGLTIYKLESFINGDLDEVIDALITADTAQKLAETNTGENI